MRVVFASDHTYLPHRVGGRESSIHEMASLYQSHGHEVTVLALRPSDRMYRLRSLLSRAAMGRRWNPAYRVLRTPDVVAAMGRMLEHELAVDCVA